MSHMVVCIPIAFKPRRLEAGGDVREPIHLFMNNISFFLIKWRLFTFQQHLPTCCPLAKATGRSKGRKRELNSLKNQEQRTLWCRQLFQQSTTKLWFPQYLDIQRILSLCKTLENLLMSLSNLSKLNYHVWPYCIFFCCYQFWHVKWGRTFIYFLIWLYYRYKCNKKMLR